MVGRERAVAAQVSVVHLVLVVVWGAVLERYVLVHWMAFEKDGENCSCEDKRGGWLLLGHSYSIEA